MRIWPIFHFETSLFSFLVFFLFLFFVLILSLILFHFSSHKIFIFSHFFRMSKFPESDGERQKGNLQQTKHGLRQRTKGLVSFWRSSGDKNAYLMLSNTPMQFSLTWLAKWCASDSGYYVYYINGHLRYCGINSIDAGRKNFEFCVIVLKIGYFYVYYTLVLLQVVNALWLVMISPVLK